MKEHFAGTIQRRNIDSAPSNQEKDKFQSFKEHYVNVSCHTAVMINALSFLIEQPEESSALLNYAPAFFGSVRKSFGVQIILSLNGLFDQREAYSFEKFFRYIKANHTKIFTREFYNHITWEDGSEEDTDRTSFEWIDIKQAIEESEKLITEKQPILNKLSTLRDKRFAHYENSTVEEKVYLTEVKEIFKIAESIINKFTYLFDRERYALTPIDADDIKKIAEIAKNYKKYRSVIFNEMHKENLENQKNENK